ncbi:SDR family NAD(P)-dependent oxidoreductase [Clostridium botulinum]|uniref:SDR family NAD(P)-dependent oxidoreductase n=1 Tax=Clostridium botulinum TaxID=1491 RepID=UPI0031016A18
MEKLNEVKVRIEKTGRKVVAVRCDVTNEKSVKNAMQMVLDTFRHIDILLNNTGVAVRGG